MPWHFATAWRRPEPCALHLKITSSECVQPVLTTLRFLGAEHVVQGQQTPHPRSLLVLSLSRARASFLSLVREREGGRERECVREFVGVGVGVLGVLGVLGVGAGDA